ncbi:transglutaminase-like putative cysteine protease [Novosphingobium sp. PhB165]|uniref:transglutaminase-like domain-containing protein n=1 Tax=Novosphingobium sp. PhB165 TaxID=2485105 RepID=UPI0010EDA628|nr:transglutaminase family protein [Novosphingobium sp. PhB165]TCM19383.1 transglutaminase-like putative cysteine protease [Novosphingobium sp. PhB165]
MTQNRSDATSPPPRAEAATKLSIHARLDYQFDKPTDILLQLEAAIIPEQQVLSANIDLPPCEHFARVPAQDCIGERIWLRAQGNLRVDYRAIVSIERLLADCRKLDSVPPHQLPGETIQYLMASRYCPADRFQSFAASEFPDLGGGALVMAMRDWVHDKISYVPGVSTSQTTAADTFIRRQGICRDFAHVLITLVRAVGIPARIASVYALGVEPQDFHAVAEVFLGGEWHLIDATGMAREAAMAKIGVGRDAADVAFLTAYGDARMKEQQVLVEPAA